MFHTFSRTMVELSSHSTLILVQPLALRQSVSDQNASWSKLRSTLNCGVTSEGEALLALKCVLSCKRTSAHFVFNDNCDAGYAASCRNCAQLHTIDYSASTSEKKRELLWLNRPTECPARQLATKRYVYVKGHISTTAALRCDSQRQSAIVRE